ncbi:hypothetical protein ANO14919_019570 [Xylariales sp. No.14919]|nr:hypothetical protein ANO14919_019570 [Xylariales sp. No.14919]
MEQLLSASALPYSPPDRPHLPRGCCFQGSQGLKEMKWVTTPGGFIASRDPAA